MARARFTAPLAMGCCTASSWSRSPLSPRRSWEWLRTSCPDRPRATIAVLSLILTALAPAAWAQIAAIVLGALAGFPGLPAGRTASPVAGRRSAGQPAHGDRVRRPLCSPCWRCRSRQRGAGAAALAAAFYRSGALVFGGGHVVLPLLRAAVVDPGWVSDSAFLAGYGAAQAVPGPLFTFAAYLGAVASVPPGGVAGAALALVAIFAPGLLLLMAALVFWQGLRARGAARAAMAGVNAAVVGLLASALYNPGMDERGPGADRFRHRGGGLCRLNRLARAAAARRRCDRRRRRLQRCCLGGFIT